MAREVKVNIRMSEEKKKELQMHADNYGVSMSALAAMVIGQWLHQQNQVVAPIIQQMREQAVQMVQMAANGSDENKYSDAENK